MPLKHFRKNSTEASKKKIIGTNINVLTESNNNKPKGQRKPAAQIKAIAIAVAINKPSKKK
jgi:hypothetical protein